MSDQAQRYVVISTDGHCGADVFGYKPYLESRYHDEFDVWAANYRDGWIATDEAADPDSRLGQASDEAPLNWESQRRLQVMEEQGVVAEVLFPNTSPPFYPSGAITAPAPRTQDEYDHRWAGIRAHNRWLVDFCSEAPGRRAGMAQVFLENIDDTVTEIRWAREAGLNGVLLPGSHVQKMINLYYPEYDAVWAACQDLDMPVCFHATQPVESHEEAGWGAPLVGMFELPFHAKRHVGHLIAGAVFDRFPDLKAAPTELTNGSDLPSWLAGLDAQVAAMAQFDAQFPFTAQAARVLRRRPSEYFQSNVYVAGPMDLLESITAGTPNLMFGADLPHAEGTWPYTNVVIRLAVSQMSEQEARQFLSERAARVYGFDLDLLQGVADRVGPTAAELRTPPAVEELPRWPDDTRCMALSGVIAVQSNVG